MAWKSPNWCKLDFNNFKDLAYSLDEFYPLRGRPSQFHPVLTLFARNNLHQKRLNHKYELTSIDEISERVTTNAKFVKATVMAHCNSHKKSTSRRTCFVKEIPILNKAQLKLWDRVKQQPLRCHHDTYEFYRNLYHLENSSMVEVLCTFLTSNLTENNLSPHFPLFYGTVNCQFKNFTFPERASKDLKVSKPLVPKKYRVVREGSKKRIQVNNCPVQLLFTEMIGEETLGDLIDREKFQPNRWRAYCFQVIAALSIVQSRYKMHHNDLHVNNLICQKTKKTHLFYRDSTGTLFKVPTYGRIIKMVDWGRGILQYGNKTINNQCFEPDGDVFGQFLPPTSIVTKRRTVRANNSIDMIMFAYTMLESFYLNSSEYESFQSSHSSTSSISSSESDTDSPQNLRIEVKNRRKGGRKKTTKIKTHNLDAHRRKRMGMLPKNEVVTFLLSLCDHQRGGNFYTNCQKLNFSLYCQMAKWGKGAVPRELVKHPVFQSFRSDTKIDTSSKTTVYSLE